MVRFIQKNNIIVLEDERNLFLTLADKYDLLNIYNPKEDIIVNLLGRINKNEILLQNTIWKYDYIDNVKTPTKLPRINKSSTSENECLQFEIEFIDRISGGMSSWYGFSGFYLCVIIDPINKVVLDVRGEVTS